MNHNELSLQYFLAEETLKDIFSHSKKADLQYQELHDLCFDYMSKENVLNFYARFFRSEINKKAAKIVIDSLTAEKKKFIRLRFGEHKQLLSLSFALNVSVAQLRLWEQNIIEKIVRFSRYRLSPEDIFHKRKISGILEILEQTIDFFSVLSNDCIQIRQEWLADLKRKKTNYSIIFDKIQKIEKKNGIDFFSRVVIAKIQNPNDTLENIASVAGLDKGTASRYLKKFVDSQRKYLK